MRERAILHIDMNAFCASVAQHLNPALRSKAIAVASDPKRRNGIILAKSREAKAAGVKTEEAIWQAQQKCPRLVVVPPDYRAYKGYSRLARMLYYEYTNQVEPFGLDESWIDVTGSLHLFGGVAAHEGAQHIETSVYTHPHAPETPTRSLGGAYRIARLAMGLLRANQSFDRAHALRAIHVRATNLVAMDGPRQLDLFGEEQATWRQERLDLAIDALRRRFGNSCVRRVVELTDETMRQVDIKRDNTVHPIGFLR